MSRLTDLLRRLDPRQAAQQAHRLATLIESNRALGRRVRGLEEALDGTGRTLASLRRQQEKLAALQAAIQRDDAALARVDATIHLEALASHVAAAADAAVAVEAGLWVVDGIWPADVLDLMVETLPPAVLFDAGEDGSASIPVPPPLAGVATVVLWEALVDAVVGPVLAPRVASRIPGATATPSACRLIVLPGEGTTLASNADRPVAAACVAPLGPFAPGAVGRFERGGSRTSPVTLGNALVIVERPTRDDRLVAEPSGEPAPRFAFAFQLH